MKQTTFTPAEMEALKTLVEFAAKNCGGGEDIIGAILYTGAGRRLKEAGGDGAVVALADKIEGIETGGMMNLKLTKTAYYSEIGATDLSPLVKDKIRGAMNARCNAVAPPVLNDEQFQQIKTQIQSVEIDGMKHKLVDDASEGIRRLRLEPDQG